MLPDAPGWDPEGDTVFDPEQHPVIILKLTRLKLTPDVALLDDLIQQARPPPRPSVWTNYALPAINARPGFR